MKHGKAAPRLRCANRVLFRHATGGLDRSGEDQKQNRAGSPAIRVPPICCCQLEMSRSKSRLDRHAAPLCRALTAVVSLSLRPAPVSRRLPKGPKLRSAQKPPKVNPDSGPTPACRSAGHCAALASSRWQTQNAALITPTGWLSRSVNLGVGPLDILPTTARLLPLHLFPSGSFLLHVPICPGVSSIQRPC